MALTTWFFPFPGCREATERLQRQDELKKRLVDADVSREIYREKIAKAEADAAALAEAALEDEED
jgi:hypothetical protein